MAGKQLEISYGEVAKRAGIAIIFGSLLTPWLIFLSDYVWTVASGERHWFYSAFSILEMQIMCLPFFGYQFPSYLASNIICASLFKRGLLKSKKAVYFIAGFVGWLGSSALLFTNNVTYDIESMLNTAIMGIPSLLIYYILCLLPKEKK
jgi:hypothetical protein